MSRIILLAGPRGAGKTGTAQVAAVVARRCGLRVGGLLAPTARDRQGWGTHITALDLATGEARSLAHAADRPAEATVGRFRFGPHALAWARQRVLDALQAPLDLVLVDEIGPLELRQGGGLAAALDALPPARTRNVVLLVRSELCAELYARLRPLHPLVVRLHPQRRGRAALWVVCLAQSPARRRAAGRRSPRARP